MPSSWFQRAPPARRCAWFQQKNCRKCPQAATSHRTTNPKGTPSPSLSFDSCWASLKQCRGGKAGGKENGSRSSSPFRAKFRLLAQKTRFLSSQPNIDWWGWQSACLRCRLLFFHRAQTRAPWPQILAEVAKLATFLCCPGVLPPLSGIGLSRWPSAWQFCSCFHVLVSHSACGWKLAPKPDQAVQDRWNPGKTPECWAELLATCLFFWSSHPAWARLGT